MAKPQVVHNDSEDVPNEILMYQHCRRCIRELPVGESAANYARLSIGFTKKGLQVWCERHNMNVDRMEIRAVEQFKVGDSVRLVAPSEIQRQNGKVIAIDDNGTHLVRIFEQYRNPDDRDGLVEVTADQMERL